MQKFLEGLSAVHQIPRGFRNSPAEPDGGKSLTEAISANRRVRHPVVRRHPETGKQALFVNSRFTTHIEGLRSAESDALLQFLFAHIATDEFSCRFQWQSDSVALWDNRCTQHKPVNDFFPARRRMQRVTIDGDKSY